MNVTASSARSCIFFIAIALAALVGCPKAKATAEDAGSTHACAHIGESCEFSPGKLGTCVQNDDCAMPPCFVCQSQH